MKAVRSCLTAILITACSPGSHKPPVAAIPQATGENVQILEFTPQGNDVVPPPLQGLILQLSVPPSQPPGQGLQFALKLVNTDTGPVTLHTPYDVFTYQLSNHEGWPIALRSPPSRAKTRRFVDRAPYITVGGIQANGAELPIGPELELEQLTLQAGSTYTYQFTINATAPPQGQESPTHVVPGTYTLKASVSLIPVVPSTPPGATMITAKTEVTIGSPPSQ